MHFAACGKLCVGVRPVVAPRSGIGRTDRRIARIDS
jgi:hypothetical protein